MQMPRKSYPRRAAAVRTAPKAPAADAIDAPNTAPGAPAQAPEASALPTFRVGEYEVGHGTCEELCGHPDILY